VGIVTLAAVAALGAFLTLRSRRNPLFLAGAAAWLVLGRSLYMDIVPWRTVAVVWSIAVTSGDLIFAAAALGWVYARRRRPMPCVRLAPIWVVLGILIASFLTLELVLAAVTAGDVHPTMMLATREWFYIPLGYLIALDVLRRFTLDETEQYVGVLSAFTVCAFVLYIASALNVPIYPYEKYLATSYGSTTVVRDFLTIPFWAGLAWSYYLSQPRKGVWTYVAMAVVACGLLFSYTRSFLALLVVTTLLAAGLFLAGRGQRARGVIVGVAVVTLAVAVLVLGPVVAPAQFGYYGERLGGTASVGSVPLDANAQGRLESFAAARAAGARVDPYLGTGLPAPAGSLYGQMYINADSDWISIVYHSGLVGILVFASPFAVALWRGFAGFRREEPSSTAGTLLLTAMLATVWLLGWRFASAVYMWWPAVSLLSVALVARAEAVAAPPQRQLRIARQRAGRA